MADELPPASPTSETPPPRTTGGNFRWEPPTAEELQALMPGYTIEKILGRGGMGAVYRGVQTNLDRPVAIKILPPGVEKEDPSFAERFKSEARLMARLSNPAVVGVYDFGTNLGGQLYFAMEYVDGSDVSQMIAAQGKLPPEHALAITAHVCDALSAAHELGIVHRDIKPANVLINMKGQVKVADFGLAKIEDPGQHGLTKTGYAMGTPDFVAPEALMLGTAVDGRADLYAVGVMLYQMITGNIPRGAFRPASVLVPGLDPRFDAIIMKAMQHDRSDRHQDAMELRRELDVILTVPFVRNDAPVSAAIPVAQVAQAPGQRSAAQKPQGKAPQPRSADAPVRQPASPKAGEGTRAPTKSKTPLFIGLGAAAALGIGAFVMFSGGKKTPPAAVGESAPPAKPGSVASATPKPAASTAPASKPTTAPASSVSKSPSLPISPSSDKFPPGQWVKPFTKFEDLPPKARNEYKLTWKDGWIDGTNSPEGYMQIDIPNSRARNQGVRARLKQDPRASGPYPCSLKLRSVTGKRYTLNYHLGDRTVRIELAGDTTVRALSTQKPKQVPQEGAEYELEFYAIGQRLIGRMNGELLSIGTDASLAEGSIAFSVKHLMRDIEVINLDGLSEAEALKILGVDEKGHDLRKPAAVAATAPASSASSSPSPPVSKSSDPKFPPGQWVKLFTKYEDLPENLRKAGMKFEDGWIRCEAGAAQRIYVTDSLSNYAIRATIQRQGKEYQTKTLMIRAAQPPSATGYALCLSIGNFWFGGRKSDGTPSNEILWQAHDAAVRVPRIGEEYTLEWGCVGDKLIGRIGKEFVKVTTDTTWSRGAGYFTGGEPIRDIEVINLDGLPEAEALRLLGVDEKGNDLRTLAAKQEQQKAEMAQAVDAMAAIPELKALHEQFVKLQAERVTAPFAAEVAKLNAGYVGGIDREIANEKKAGHLDGVIALEAEKKLIADKQPIPAEDEAATTDALKKLRGIYRAAYAKIEAARAENLKALTDPLDNRLKQIEAALTQQDRISHAKTVREYREGLGRADGPPSAAAPPQTALGGPSAPPSGGKSAGASPSTSSQPKIPKPKDAFNEREAAEWALSFAGKGGASVTILIPGKGEQQIQSLAQLPKEKFLVRKLTAQPSQEADRDLITDQEATRLMGLEDVREIHLTGGKLSGLALRALAQMPTLEVLHFQGANLTAADLAALENAPFSDLYLPGFLLKDEAAMRVFSTLKNLRSLSLGDLINSEVIAAMPVLPKLDTFTSATNDRVLDDLLPLLPQKFPALQRIDLWAAIKIQGETLGSLKNLKDLRDLGLNYTQVDDAKLTAIADMKQIQALGISGTKVTDACIATLKTLKNLTTLGIFKTQITDAGLLQLAELRSLKTLNVRHPSDPPFGPPATGFTQAGVDAFQKKRPDVKVTR